MAGAQGQGGVQDSHPMLLHMDCSGKSLFSVKRKKKKKEGKHKSSLGFAIIEKKEGNVLK
jgi:hypothetical protein